MSESGELFVTLTDNSVTNLGSIKGEKGDKGETGEAGKGIEDISYNEAGQLVIKYTDGTEQTIDINGGSTTTNKYNIGDIITFGTYEQDGDETNGKEPIEWIVVETNGDKVMLLSKYILDEQPFLGDLTNEEIKSRKLNTKYAGDSAGGVVLGVDFEGTDLYEWLNNDFYNEAFNSNDKAKIIDHKPTNSYYNYFYNSDTYHELRESEIITKQENHVSILSKEEYLMFDSKIQYDIDFGATEKVMKDYIHVDGLYAWLRNFRDADMTDYSNFKNYSFYTIFRYEKNGNYGHAIEASNALVPRGVRPVIWITVE